MRWNIAAGVVLTAVNLAVVPLSILTAGLENYGAWMLAGGIGQLLGQADFGLGTAIVHRLAATRSSGANELGAIVAVGRSLFGWIALGLTVMGSLSIGTYFMLTADTNGVLLQYALAGGASIGIVMLSRLYSAVLQSNNRFDLERLGVLAGQALRLAALSTLVLADTRGYWTLILADMIGILLTLVVSGRLSHRYGGYVIVANLEKRRWKHIARGLIRFSLPAFISASATLASIQSPLILSGILLGYREAGAMAVLIRLYQSARTVIGWVSAPYLPAAAQSSGTRSGSTASSRKLHDQAVVLCGIIGGLMGYVWISAGDAILTLWLGDPFREYGASLGVLGVGIVIHSLYAPGVVIATGMGDPGVAARYNLAMLAAGLGLSIVGGMRFATLGLVGGLTASAFLVFPLSGRATTLRTGLGLGRFFAVSGVVVAVALITGYATQIGLRQTGESSVTHVLITLGIAGIFLTGTWINPKIRKRIGAVAL